MRVTILTAGTNNTMPLYEPLRELGNQLTVLTYDAMAEHSKLPDMVRECLPDWVLLIGAIEAHHGKPVPRVDVLSKIGEAYPMVHLCCDGAEPAWWAQLQSYYDEGRFALQVNIDGVRTGPIGDRGLTMLCPIDPAQFPDPPRPWSKRPIHFGFAGNTHRGAREALIAELIKRQLLVFRPRDEDGYEGYREFLSCCRCVLNNPATGGGTSKHVKARMIEAALAGSIILEEAGSPAAHWFDEGVDYLSYKGADDIAVKLAWVREHRGEAEAIAKRMREKVIAEHGPEIFWGHVMERMGIGTSSASIRQVPYRYWGPGAAVPVASSRELTQSTYDHVPRLIRSRYGRNFVSYQGRVFVIPQKLGRVNLEDSGPRHRDIQSYPSMNEAERLCTS